VKKLEFELPIPITTFRNLDALESA